MNCQLSVVSFQFQGAAASRFHPNPLELADAAHYMVTQPSRMFTGRFLIDEDVLRESGMTDLARYNPEGVSDGQLMRDFFV